DGENINNEYNYSDYYENATDEFGPCDSSNVTDFGKVFLPTLYSLVFIIGFLGNGLVVCVLVKHRNQTNLTDICLFSLALSDLLFVFTLPFYSHYAVTGVWAFGDFMCRFLSGSHTTGFFSSIFFMVVMTIDRYLAIMHTHQVAQYRNLRTGIVLNVSVWMLSLTVSLPAFIFSKVTNESHGLTCEFLPENHDWKNYNIFSTNILGLVIPLLVMIICYSRILPIMMNLRTAKRHRVVKLIISIVIAFFLFWAPYNICLFVMFLKSGDQSSFDCKQDAIQNNGENSTIMNPDYYDGNDYGPCDSSNVTDFGKVFLPTLYSLVFIIGFLGNGLVVCVLVKHRNQTSLPDICLFSLALSDLLFVFTLPFYSHYTVTGVWAFGDFMCRFLSGSHTTGFFSSVFFMVVMTIDRYLAIMHALKVAQYRNLRTGIILTTFVWMLSLTVSLPAFIFSKVTNESHGLTCEFLPENHGWKNYNIFSTNILGLMIPLLVMIVCYSRIFPMLQNLRTAKRHRVVKLIISIVIAFFLSWVPYNICLFVMFLKSGDQSSFDCKQDAIQSLNPHLFCSLSCSMNISENDTAMPYEYDDDYNYSTCDQYPPQEQSRKSMVLPVLYYMLFCLSLLGNTTVLWLLLRHIKLKTMTDICLLNLALSDLILAVSLPLWAYNSQNLASCKVITGVYELGFYSGTLFVILMSVDRYLAIVHAVAAMRARTLCYGIIASITIWVVSIIMAIPQVIFASLEIDVDSFQCHPQYPEDWVHFWKMLRNFSENTVGLFVGLPIMIFCYVKILIVLSKSRNSKKDRAVKLIFTIVCAFVVCWVPYNIIIFLKTLQLFDILNTCVPSKAIDTAMIYAEIIALSHCCVNPIIYAFVGEKFRKSLGNMLTGHLCWSHRSRVNLSTTDRETSNTPVKSDYKDWQATAISAFTAFSGFSENQTMEDALGSTTESFTAEVENFTEYYDYLNYSDDGFGRCVYEGHGASFLPAIYSVFFLLGLLGNSLVIWVVACGVRLRSMTDVCLLNLAIADLLLVCSLPFLAHQAQDQWLFGDAMCKIVLGVYQIAFYCGIFFISLMSVDRYLAIVHAVYAVKARTRSFGMIAAAVTWVAGFFAAFPDLIFLKQQPSGNKTYCFPEFPPDDSGSRNPHFWRIFSLFKMNILGLFVPVIIMSFCYSQIIWRLLYSRSSRKQAIRLVLTVVAVFFCCWVPYNVSSLFKALELLGHYTECESSKAIRLALQITEAIAYSHSCLNPILYVFVGEKFRRNLLRMINRTPCTLCQAIKVLIPQDRINWSVYSQTTSLEERSTAM
ncbi:hypothetical protein L3Q82_013050, partial [Scortum barcoo]